MSHLRGSLSLAFLASAAAAAGASADGPVLDAAPLLAEMAASRTASLAGKRDARSTLVSLPASSAAPDRGIRTLAPEYRVGPALDLDWLISYSTPLAVAADGFSTSLVALRSETDPSAVAVALVARPAGRSPRAVWVRRIPTEPRTRVAFTCLARVPGSLASDPEFLATWAVLSSHDHTVHALAFRVRPTGPEERLRLSLPADRSGLALRPSQLVAWEPVGASGEASFDPLRAEVTGRPSSWRHRRYLVRTYERNRSVWSLVSERTTDRSYLPSDVVRLDPTDESIAGPGARDSLDGVATAAMTDARRSASVGDHASACRALERAVSVEPTWGEPWAMLAQSAEARGDSSLAIRACAQSLMLEGDRRDVRFRLARLLAASGDASAAESEYRRLLGDEPWNASALLLLGELYESLGEGIYSAACFRAALDPALPSAEPEPDRTASASTAERVTAHRPAQ